MGMTRVNDPFEVHWVIHPTVVTPIPAWLVQTFSPIKQHAHLGVFVSGLNISCFIPMLLVSEALKSNSNSMEIKVHRQIR